MSMGGLGATAGTFPIISMSKQERLTLRIGCEHGCMCQGVDRMDSSLAFCELGQARICDLGILVLGVTVIKYLDNELSPPSRSKA